jgi:hypothetical protein
VATESDLLQQARVLAERGDVHDAVEFVGRNLSISGDLHRRLLDLRIEAARKAGAVGPATGGPWPSARADPFPDQTGIPEIAAGELSAAVMGGAIGHHGSLIVRGLVPRDDAEQLCRDIDRVYSAFDAWAGGGEADDHWFSPIDRADCALFIELRRWNRAIGGGILAAESPAFMERLPRLFRRTGIIDIMNEFFGEPPVASVGKTTLRRIAPIKAGDFHQDGAFLGTDVRTMNVWIALSDCGVDAPGLQVVDRRLSRLVPMGGEGAGADWSVSPANALAANEGKPFACPAFSAGDAMMFDGMMLHATSYDPAMTRSRWALETWFFAPSAYAEDQVPMAI